MTVDPTSRPSGTLAGLRIVELGTMIAAPLAGMLLADHGADTIKIEIPNGGDQLRHWGHLKNGTGLLWKVIGRNKRSIPLDMHVEGDRVVLRQILREADVLIESFRPGTLEKWDLSPDSLLEENPRLILLRVSGWGQTGPYSQRPGFGTLVEAFSGFAHINGWEDRPPALPPFGLADSMAGFVGAFGILAALHAREQSGRGQVIDLALYEPILTALGSMVIDYDQLGIVQGRSGNRAPFTAPRNAYQCRDGRWFAISASNQNTAHRLLLAVGGVDLSDDLRFATNQLRVANAEALDKLIQSFANDKTLEEVLAALTEADVPVSPVNSVADLLSDEQVLDRRSIVAIDDEELGSVNVQAPIPRFSRDPGSIRHLGLPMSPVSDIDPRDPWLSGTPSPVPSDGCDH